MPNTTLWQAFKEIYNDELLQHLSQKEPNIPELLFAAYCHGTNISNPDITPWIDVTPNGPRPKLGDTVIIRWNELSVENLCERFEFIEHFDGKVDWTFATHYRITTLPDD